MLARLCGVLVLFMIWCGGAGAAEWQFRYQGFLDGETGAFLPNIILYGHFSGSDSDGDGVIGKDELTGLSINGYEYINPNCTSPAGLRCDLAAFSYSPAGALAFDATESYYDVIGHYNHVITNDRIVSASFDPNGVESRRTMYWTADTTFTITAVPEPSMAAMVSAGLLLLARQYRHAFRRGGIDGPAA